MPETSELLANFVSNRSEHAFRLLVETHLPVVLSAALPCVGGDRQLAEDAAQLVFMSLANKPPKLSKGVPLQAWLYRHAYHTASKLARSERRRATRERRYVEQMNAEDLPQTAHEMSRLIPKVLAGLGDQDRTAIFARFLEEKSFGEVGAIMGVSEDAAQKRVSRALEKVRKKLTRLGIGGSVALISEVIASQHVPPASAALATQIQEGSLSASASVVTSGICGMSVKMLASVLGGTMLVVFGIYHSKMFTPPSGVVVLDEIEAPLPSFLPDSRPKITWKNRSPLEQLEDAEKAFARMFALMSGDYKSELTAYRKLEAQGDLIGAQAKRAAIATIELNSSASRTQKEIYRSRVKRNVGEAMRSMPISSEPIRRLTVGGGFPRIPAAAFGVDKEVSNLVKQVTHDIRTTHEIRRYEKIHENRVQENMTTLVDKIGEDHPIVHLLAAHKMWVLGGKEQAMENLVAINKQHPNETPWIPQYLGDLQFRKGAYEAALSQYELANPDSGKETWYWNRWLADLLIVSPSLKTFCAQDMTSELLPELMLVEALRAQVTGYSKAAKGWVKEAMNLDPQLSSSPWMEALFSKSWAKPNPEDAIGYSGSLDDSSTASSLRKEIVEAAMESDPSKAVSLLVNSDLYDPDGLLEQSYRKWAEKDLPAVVDYVNSLQDDKQRKNALREISMTVANSDSVSERVDELKAWMDETLADYPDLKNQAKMFLAIGVLRKSPDKAKALYNEMDPGPQKDEAYMSMLFAFSRHDPEDGIGWIESIREETSLTVRQTGLDNFSRWWLMADQESAIAAALKLDSSDPTRKAILNAANQMGRVEP